MSCKNCACDVEPTTATEVDTSQVILDTVNTNFEKIVERFEDFNDQLDDLSEKVSCINQFLSSKHSELVHNGDIPMTCTDWSRMQAAKAAMDFRLNMAKQLLRSNGFEVIQSVGKVAPINGSENDTRTISV